MTATIQHKEVREITLTADNIEEPNIPQIPPLISLYTRFKTAEISQLC